MNDRFYYNHWEKGQIRYSPIYKEKYQCVCRWFQGGLELVALRRFPNGEKIFERTARAMSDPLFPGVRALGGVIRATACVHDEDILYDDHGEYCSLCGAIVEN